MSTIPKNVMDKIEAEAMKADNSYHSFWAGAELAYQLATDGREEDGEWISVHDNSDGFRDYLDLKGIEYKRNGHFTGVKKEVNLYWLGRQVEEWKHQSSLKEKEKECEELENTLEYLTIEKLGYDELKKEDDIKEKRISELEAEVAKKQKCIDDTAIILANALK